MSIRQLPLAIGFQYNAGLDDFFFDHQPLLQRVVQELLAFRGEKMLYFWGPHGSGKSHLLQGVAQGMQKKGLSALYLSFNTLDMLTPDCLSDLVDIDVLCIDDFDGLAGQPAWEESFFHLFNQIRDRDATRLLIASTLAPKKLPLVLPDLMSRLLSVLSLEIVALPDHIKMLALQRQANLRGFELPVQVAAFILHHCPRSMDVLHTLLDRLDEASLAQQRKMTIPFVKSMIDLPKK